jgi:N-acyl homoserine lactone hydrolase
VQRAAYWFAQTDASMRSWPAKWANLSHRPAWRLLDGDTTIAPGVEIIETSGHVPGHQSVLVRLPGGAVLITGDAVFDSGFFHADRAPHPFDITAESVASTCKLLEVAAAAQVREVLFGHDPEQWPRVRGTTYE